MRRLINQSVALSKSDQSTREKAEIVWHPHPPRSSHLDERDLSPQRRVDVGELEADVARADDGNPVGQPLQLQRVVAGEHSLSVNRDA